MHEPARYVQQVLIVRDEQRDQQRSATISQISCPTHLVVTSEIDNRGDEF